MDQQTQPSVTDEEVVTTEGGEGEAAETAPQATIYSTPNCHYCHAAKEFFTENEITFADIDVAADQDARQKMIEMTGQMGVPVIQIGNDVVVGFDEEKVRELLALEPAE